MDMMLGQGDRKDWTHQTCLIMDSVFIAYAVNHALMPADRTFPGLWGP